MIGLDYFINAQCPVQSKMGSLKFIQAQKIRFVLQGLGKWVEAESGKPLEETELVFPFTIKMGIFRNKDHYKVRDLRKFWGAIAKRSQPHCKGCPLNVAKHELGCGGTISYPISHKAEEWFMNQFNPPDGEKGFVAHHIKANRLTGSRMDARRPGVSANGPVFSSDIPVVKRLSAQGNPISSSQIFEFIFGCSPALLPITLLGLGTDFRIAELSDKDRKELNMIESMNQMMGSDGRGRDAFAKSKAAIVNRYPPAIKLQSEDDTSIQQLKRFFGLGWIAYMSGHPLAIDA